MNTQDALWKAIIEEFFDDFLQFFFPTYYDEIDTTFPFVVLDKELSKIYPETQSINRRGDKLIKIRLKNGNEQFILIHIEVQGYKDDNFARRMYVCQYRIDERFNLPVTALVIYTDNNKENRSSSYQKNCFGTSISYQFNTFVIADLSIAELEIMNNPFSIISQVAQLGIRRKLGDAELFDLKLTLFRKLLEKQYSKKQIRLLSNFIKEYVRFSNIDFYRKFDEQADILTNNSNPMGLYETILEIRKQEGLEQGLELENRLSDFEKIIEPLLKAINGGMTVAQIEAIFKVDRNFIEELYAQQRNWRKLSFQINALRKKFKAGYGVENLNKDLVQLLSGLTLKTHLEPTTFLSPGLGTSC